MGDWRGGNSVSVLVVAPELVTSAAADLESIGSAVNAAHQAAAVPTTGLAAAAADEVSAAAAALFAKYGQEFQALSARASAFHQQFVQALSSGSRAYLAAEAAGASLLQAVQHDLLGAVNAPTEALLGRALIGTGAIGPAASPSGGIAGAVRVAGAGAASAVDTVINDVQAILNMEFGIYDFSTPKGWAAFLLDYTWGFPGTLMGYGIQLVNAFEPNNGYDAAFSKQVGSIVYRGGVGLPGYTSTWGNVTTSLGYGAGADDRMANHEEVHVWQNRLLGPIYLGVYGGWLIGGGLVGTGYWLLHPNDDWLYDVTTTAYYDIPWEVWAYTNDHDWPPPGADPVLLW
jgi:hypothetical protein